MELKPLLRSNAVFCTGSAIASGALYVAGLFGFLVWRPFIVLLVIAIVEFMALWQVVPEEYKEIDEDGDRTIRAVEYLSDHLGKTSAIILGGLMLVPMAHLAGSFYSDPVAGDRQEFLAATSGITVFLGCIAILFAFEHDASGRKPRAS